MFGVRRLLPVKNRWGILLWVYAKLLLPAALFLALKSTTNPRSGKGVMGKTISMLDLRG